MKVKTVNKIDLILISFFIFFSAGLIEEAVATIHYVSPDGSDINSGSESSPFRTIQKAADIVNPGDTVIVKDGTYTDTDGDNYIFQIKRGGSASGGYITFKSENKWGAVLDGKLHTTTYGIMAGNDKNYIKIEDFEIKETWSTGIFLPNKYSNDYWIIKGNHIHNIGISKKTNSWEMNDEVIGRDAIYVGGLNPSASNITIDSNVFHHIGRLADPTRWTPCPDTKTCGYYTCSGCPAASQKHEYQHDHVIYLGDGLTNNIIITNNIFYENHHGFNIKMGNGVSYITVANNTFFGPNQNFIDNDYHRVSDHRGGNIMLYHTGFEGYWGQTYVTIENNISYNPANDFFIWFASVDERYHNITNFTVRNNITTASQLFDPVVSGADIQANWIMTNNKLNTDPLMIDIVGTDFSDYNFALSANSPAIEAGLSTDAPAYDFDGNVRPYGAGIDIGAYEWRGAQTYQCSDGIDNDGDGLLDMNDSGCSSATDNTEAKTLTSSEKPAAIVDINPSGTHIEAEDYTGTITQGTTAFTLETTQSGYLGSGYLLPSGGAADSCPLVSEGKAYQVNFTAAGVYNVWIRGYSSSATADSAFIGLDGTCVGAVNTNLIHNQWLWTNNLQTGTGVKTINVTSPGTHTVNIWVREPNYLMDRIYLTQGTEIPSDSTVLADTTPPSPPVTLMIQ